MASGPNPDPFPGKSPDEDSSDPINRLLFFSDSDPYPIDDNDPAPMDGLLFPDNGPDLELLEPIPLTEEQQMVGLQYAAARLQVSDPDDEQQMADPNQEEQISDPFARPGRRASKSQTSSAPSARSKWSQTSEHASFNPTRHIKYRGRNISILHARPPPVNQETLQDFFRISLTHPGSQGNHEANER